MFERPSQRNRHECTPGEKYPYDCSCFLFLAPIRRIKKRDLMFTRHVPEPISHAQYPRGFAVDAIMSKITAGEAESVNSFSLATHPVLGDCVIVRWTDHGLCEAEGKQMRMNTACHHETQAHDEEA